MKKTYINPTTQVVEIEVRQMLAASPGLGGEYGGGTPESREIEELVDLIGE